MPDKSKAELQYRVESTPVTRGEFRLLLLLMLIEVAISAQTAYAPGIVAWAKNAWAEHQAAVAHRAAVRKNEAVAAQCLSFARPVTAVVWEEDPNRAAKFLEGSGYYAVRPRAIMNDFLENAIPPAAMAERPLRIPVDDMNFVSSQFQEFTGSWLSNNRSDTTVTFLHGRTVGGIERLVLVLYGAPFEAGSVQRDEHQPWEGHISKFQSFAAMSFGRGEDGMFSAMNSPVTALSLAPLNNSDPITTGVSPNSTLMPAHWSPPPKAGLPGKVTIDYRNQFRVYAGQSDPADASHFTIAYDLDGQAGVVDGWLKPDGSVVLEPRVGKRVNTVWYPHAK
jgi:hypothetical protein